jgi:putative addiction module component (TIGR02574 family)
MVLGAAFMPQAIPSAILEAAMALSPEARTELANIVLDSLDRPMPTEIEEEWAKEITRRIATYECDPSTAIPGTQVLAELGSVAPE